MLFLPPRLAAAALLLVATAAAAQPVPLALTRTPSAPADSVAVPNGTWATTPYENEAVLNDDWTFDGAGAGPAVAFFLTAGPGSPFGAASATVAWDGAALGLQGVDATGGLFAAPGGTLFWNPLGSAGGVTVDAARLDLTNQTPTAGAYVARLDFALLRPGFSAVDFGAVDLRAYDGVGGQTTVAATTRRGAVRAYLGDVAAAVGIGPPDVTRGDGRVEFEDVNIFAGAYYAGTSIGGNSAPYKSKYDIGPTADATPFTRPQRDGQVEFEDLVVFAASYGYTLDGTYPRAGAPPPPLHVEPAPARVEGTDLLVAVEVRGAADLRAVALELLLADGLAWVGAEHAPGGLLGDRDAFLIGRAAGASARADVAALGGAGLDGSGALLVVRLRPADGSPARFAGRTDLVRLTAVRARTSRNVPVPIASATTTGAEGADAPGLLLAAGPSPARGPVRVAFSLPASGAPLVAVYDVLGRHVATLATGARAAGEHAVTWDPAGRPAGPYFIVLDDGGRRLTRRVTVLR